MSTCCPKKHLYPAACTAAFLVVLLGCGETDNAYKEALSSSVSSLKEKLADTPAMSPSSAEEKPTPNTQPTSTPATPSNPFEPPIQLSTGVALAQTGPNGTMMLFSADYQFTNGGPNSASKYGWIIEPAQGKAIVIPVMLKQKGTLQVPVAEWRLENGPFRGHLEEKVGSSKPRQISKSIDLR